MAEVEMQGGKQMRFTESELSEIKSLYHNNYKLLYTLSDLFLPELDANIQFGKQSNFYAPIDTGAMSPEQVARKVEAINVYVKHLQVCLAQLWTLSDTKMEFMNTPLSGDERKQAVISAYKQNDKGLKLLRKIFYPEIDPDAPIGQVVDMFAFIDNDKMTPEELWRTMSARKDIINHVEATINSMSIMANTEEKTSAQILKEQRLNSSK